MKKIKQKNILMLLLFTLLAFGMSSCSSWRKSRCGECPRWTYNQTIENYNQII